MEDEIELIRKTKKTHGSCIGGSNRSREFKKDVRELANAFNNFESKSEVDQNELLHRYQPKVQKWDIDLGLSDSFSNDIRVNKDLRKKFTNIVTIYKENKVELRKPVRNCVLM
jgi:hypothetical protein